jgi:hypothetical protein
MAQRTPNFWYRAVACEPIHPNDRTPLILFQTRSRQPPSPGRPSRRPRTHRCSSLLRVKSGRSSSSRTASAARGSCIRPSAARWRAEDTSSPPSSTAMGHLQRRVSPPPMGRRRAWTGCSGPTSRGRTWTSSQRTTPFSAIRSWTCAARRSKSLSRRCAASPPASLSSPRRSRCPTLTGRAGVPSTARHRSLPGTRSAAARSYAPLSPSRTHAC